MKKSYLKNSTNMIMVFDLDGCMLNSEHRYKLKPNGKIDLEHWRENSTPDQIAKDKPINHVIDIYKKAIKDPSVIVIVATARIVCDASHISMLKHLGTFPDHLSSRKDQHDTRSGNAIKGQYVRKFLKTLNRWHEVIFYDDNRQYLADFLGEIPQATIKHIPSKQGH